MVINTIGTILWAAVEGWLDLNKSIEDWMEIELLVVNNQWYWWKLSSFWQREMCQYKKKKKTSLQQNNQPRCIASKCSGHPFCDQTWARVAFIYQQRLLPF